jgi:uncharacterized protein YjdB
MKKMQQEDQNLILCKNCGGRYDPEEPTCPYCGEETNANVDAAHGSALDVTKYGGGFGEGSTFPRIVMLLLVALLVILVIGVGSFALQLLNQGEEKPAQNPTSSVSQTQPEEPDASQSSDTTPEVVTAETIALNNDELTLEEGGSTRLFATVTPAEWSGTVRWQSSDPAVATVDDAGNVTWVGEGSCIITAEADQQQVTCAVTCKAPQPDLSEATDISLNYTDITLRDGESLQLVATVQPEGWTGSVSWTSDDASVAEVDVNGNVTFVSSGSCTVTAKAGAQSVTCVVRCRGAENGSNGGENSNNGGENSNNGGETGASSSLSVGYQGWTDITLNNPGDGVTLQATGGNGTYSWSSSNSAVATVTSSGSVYAVGSGTCTITVTSGGQSASCTIRVK